MATLTLPMSAAMGALSRAQTGTDILRVLDVLVETDAPTAEDQAEYEAEVPSDAYVMENDYNDDV
jgi:hypothetical protein